MIPYRDGYVMMVHPDMWDDFTQAAWRSALARARSQLSRLRYW